MRILGHHGLKRRYRDVPLGDFEDDGTEALLRLYAPSLTVVQQVNDEFDADEPPPVPLAPLSKGVETNDRGEPLLDSEGRSIAKRDSNAPSYLNALREQDRLQGRITRAKSVAMVVIAAEGVLTFDVTRDQHTSALAYHEAVRTEMEKGGIDFGRFRCMDDAVGEMLELSSREVATANEALEGTGGQPQKGN